uniref:LRR receptor-like serine/threonine-protein kinase GSO1 n=1 Tax=Erigeron canadensis TaxID=72917 RepID=UPI001CB9C95E|nr:LRR receptor-like serine/threonine-protein kinase GSO1 [Erigeron canadensis]
MIGNLKSLESLDLSTNKLSGGIPRSLDSLNSLGYLKLSFNKLSGLLPTGSHFRTFEDPAMFEGNNELCDDEGKNGSQGFSWFYADSIGTLSSLIEISLSGSHLSGSIPPSLGGLSSLTYLSLSDNQLNGGIPESIGLLTSLQYVFLCSNQLYSNQLSGTIPTSIGQLLNLQELDFLGNKLNGSIPESIGLLTSLQMLFLDRNQLSGNIPSSIGQLSNLEVLSHPNNQLSGVVYEIHFIKLYNTTYLDLSGNSLITFNVSRHWIPPFQLRIFHASSCCNMGPQFPNWLQTQTHLTELHLRNSSIRESIPEWFHNISSHLYYLDLSDNEIGPEFPNIQTSTDLEYLDLSNSSIRDSIPGWFQNISSHLRSLDLSDNEIHGNLPRIIANNNTDN